MDVRVVLDDCEAMIFSGMNEAGQRVYVNVNPKVGVRVQALLDEDGEVAVCPHNEQIMLPQRRAS